MTEARKKHAGGRPLTGDEPLNNRVFTMMTASELQAADCAAAALGLSRAAVVRRALAEFCRRLQTEHGT